MRIAILGKTGAGKSSLANTIFNQTVFEPDDTLNSGTTKCQAETRSVNGRSITLVDTLGFFDTDRSEEEMKQEMVRCIAECAPGPHAFLIVLKVEKVTVQEQAVINKMQQYFSTETFKYATVVFTHGDQLSEGRTIEDLVQGNKAARDLVEKCGGRCHVIDNKYWKDKPKDEYRSNEFQVEALLKTIDKIMTDNNGRCYTNEMLQIVEEGIQQEEQNIRLSSGNMTEVEIRQQARDRVFKQLLIKLAGVGTGALLGAFLGVAVMCGLVVTVLKSIVRLQALVRAMADVARASGATGGAAGATGEVEGTAQEAAAEGTAAVVQTAQEAVAEVTTVVAQRMQEVVADGTTVVTRVVQGAAKGAAAGGTAAAAAKMSLRTVMKGSTAAGVVIGGVTGYIAAEGADTPQEAARRAAVAVKDETVFVLDLANAVLEKILPSK